MLIKTEAIVLQSLKYSEADLIVKLYTKSSGLRSYLLRGILKSKKGKLKSSLFQPLSLLEIEAVHKDKGTLERLREAKILYPYKSLQVDFVKNAMVFFLADILKNAIKEEETNTALYDFLATSFRWLDNQEAIANFHIAFLIKLSQYLGFYPDTSTIEASYFNLQEGCFEEHPTDKLCYTGESVQFFKQFLGTTFEECSDTKLTKKIRASLLDLLLIYYELHLHGFTKPKSLSVLNELFK
ncbi:DNA repair protein RecO [Aquimarina brevivitae]|uniref:DNA repair protein RecO n=1 Tax=Aquimarina brevivitae TaxID=323412 RepID=A0A4Q7PFK5_9FLAO|nr:DNA repair protein RecO [Aquimarina brevivitae]RZS99115.1 DNA replication and repair protein RecO [Aquimarina brevivitae]